MWPTFAVRMSLAILVSAQQIHTHGLSGREDLLVLYWFCGKERSAYIPQLTFGLGNFAIVPIVDSPLLS
jgi:hypothetical protein